MNSLPTDILNHFSQSKIARKFAIEIGCSDTDLSEFAKNSERELTNALSRGKRPPQVKAEFVIVFFVLCPRSLAIPFLHLYTLSLSQCILLNWTCSLIIPIMKPNTACLCKVLERVVLKTGTGYKVSQSVRIFTGR